MKTRMAKVVRTASLIHHQKKLKKVSISFDRPITNCESNIYSVSKTKAGGVQNHEDGESDSPPKKVKKSESISFNQGPITNHESNNYPVSITKTGGVCSGDLSDVDNGWYFAWLLIRSANLIGFLQLHQGWFHILFFTLTTHAHRGQHLISNSMTMTMTTE
jgi:hypothetical protein